jgi:hypothetical protein
METNMSKGVGELFIYLLLLLFIIIIYLLYAW